MRGSGLVFPFTFQIWNDMYEYNWRSLVFYDTQRFIKVTTVDMTMKAHGNNEAGEVSMYKIYVEIDTVVKGCGYIKLAG